MPKRPQLILWSCSWEIGTLQISKALKVKVNSMEMWQNATGKKWTLNSTLKRCRIQKWSSSWLFTQYSSSQQWAAPLSYTAPNQNWRQSDANQHPTKLWASNRLVQSIAKFTRINIQRLWDEESYSLGFQQCHDQDKVNHVRQETVWRPEVDNKTRNWHCHKTGPTHKM